MHGTPDRARVPAVPTASATAIARLRRRLAELDEERAAILTAIEALQGPSSRKQLTKPNRNANTDNIMTPMAPITQQQYSKGARTSPKVQRLLYAIHAARIPSLRALAELARQQFPDRKIQQAHLSFAAQGLRPMDADLADWIAQKTGYAATEDNWEKLRKR